MLDWYVVSLRWYRGLILGCVECRHGVSNWMSYSEILIDIKPDDGHIWPKHVVLILTLKNIHFYISYEVCFWLPSHLSSSPIQRWWHSLKYFGVLDCLYKRKHLWKVALRWKFCQNWINYLNILSHKVSVVLQGFATYTATVMIGKLLRDSQAVNWNCWTHNTTPNHYNIQA